jgi:hypothetical protein
MADKIVADYIVKTDEAVKNLNRLEKEVKDLQNQGKKSAKDIESNFNKTSSSLISQFSKVGAALGIAFSTAEIIAFGKEAVTLAAQMEGVERAFKRVGGANSGNLLKGLRDATRGTVSDLQLMQKAVQASNFKIPLENLASLFKFAQARARETGESVEYLTNSIVLGIGRKSPLILDNLGISAVELRERLKGVGIEAANVGDIAAIIGDIAEEELAKMGDQADTAADKIDALKVKWENLRVEVGKGLLDLAGQLGILENNTPYEVLITQSIDYANQTSRASKQIIDEYEREQRAIEEISNTREGALKAEEFANSERLRRLEQLNNLESEYSTLSSNETRKAEQLKLFFAKERLDASVGLRVFERTAAQEAIDEINGDIAKRVTRQGVIEEQINALREILGLNEDINGANNDGSIENEIRNVFFLQKAIKDLKEERGLEGTSRERILTINKELIPLEEELAILLGKQAKAADELSKSMKTIAIKEAQTRFEDFFFTFRDGVVVLDFMGNSLDGLNDLLKEQQDILNSSPEFSKQYDDASDAIDKLQKKIKEFNDERIDPSQGNPEYAPSGSMSATGQGLLGGGGEDDDETPLGEQLQDALQLWQDFYSKLSEIQSQANQMALSNLNRRFEAEEITREQYEEKRRALLRKQASQEKANAIIQATINTALAVTAALNTQPFLPLGPVAAAIAGAAGAIQIGAIAAQPLPQFAEGGWVDSKGKIHGRSHAQGGVKLEAEGDEFIVKGKVAKTNASLLEALNAGNGQEWINKNMVYPAIQNVIDSGVDGGSDKINNLNIQFKDHNLIHSDDMTRSTIRNGFKFLAKELKTNNQKRGGYHA